MTPPSSEPPPPPSYPTYASLRLLRSPRPGVVIVELGGGTAPTPLNALTDTTFTDLPSALAAAATDAGVRAVVLRGAAQGGCFCNGVALPELFALSALLDGPCEARGRARLQARVQQWQRGVTSLEDCPLPVVAAVHGPCVGGGLALSAACDLRYASEDAIFASKEVDVGVTADLGDLGRLPRLVGDGPARDWCLTGREVPATEAAARGFVTRGDLKDRQAVWAAAEDAAAALAAKSPVAVAGTKRVLLRARDVSLAAHLDGMATWAAAFLPSADVRELAAAAAGGRAPVFAGKW